MLSISYKPTAVVWFTFVNDSPLPPQDSEIVIINSNGEHRRAHFGELHFFDVEGSLPVPHTQVHAWRFK